MKHFYCRRYKHFKHVIVCLASCPKPCEQLEELRQRHPLKIEQLMRRYVAQHPTKYELLLELVPVKKGGRAMEEEKRYYAQTENGETVVGSEEEVLDKVRSGVRYKEIFVLGGEHEVVMKLAPLNKKSAEPKAKRGKAKGEPED